MKKKYIQISRTNYGSYIETFDNIHNTLDGEFDGAEVGDEITLDVVEMDDLEYTKLPAFTGW